MSPSSEPATTEENNNLQWNAIMATAVIASVPTAVLLVIAQRYVAASVTAGAVKS